MSKQSSDVETTPRPEESITQNDIGGPEELMAAIDATMKPVSEGELVAGKVVKIDQDEVLVDIGYKSEGVIPLKELSLRHDVDPGDVVTLGDEIECLVLIEEDKEGRLILSKKRATYERAWNTVEEKKRKEEPVEGKVIEVVKGGLIVDIGLRGFLPASLVDLRRVKDLNQFVGQKIVCKIIELDRNRNNVVLSRRAYLEEMSAGERQQFLENLEVGEVRKGQVSSIVNYGVFVDLGGMDGMVHISELSWKHVEHPSEVVEVGQEIEVEVLDVDRDRERVSLSLKNRQEDPWEKFGRTYQIGDVVEGKITKTVPFGAFVEVGEGIEGLVHISELSEEHVELAEEVVSVGQEVKARVIDIDLERRRISLSIRQASESAIPVEYTTSTAGIVPDKPEPTEEPEIQKEEPRIVTDAGDEAATAVAGEEEAPKKSEEEPAIAAEEPPQDKAPRPEEELEGELLEKEREGSDESLEDIVEDMKKDLSS